MAISVQEVAALVGGKLIGSGTGQLRAARILTQAGPGDVTFVVDDQHDKELSACQAGAILAPPGVRHGATPIIEVADPLSAFLTVYQQLHPPAPPPPPGIAPQALIDPSAQLGPDCTVLPHAQIGAGTSLGARCRIYPGVIIGRHCRLGDDVTLYPNVVIYDGCELGHRVMVHANAVIGADGFGYRLRQGKHVKIPQLSSVIIEDDVEIGAGTCIDRGTFAPTRIGMGTKIDNMVQIGHNCTIGKHNLLISQVGIGGSSTTGDYVVMAGQVGVADHCHIGDQAVLGARSGVPGDIPAKAKVLGTPARPEREAKIILLTLDKLPELRRDVLQIKRHLGIAG